MPAPADALARWMASLRGRWLDLTVAGRVFGGRPGESPVEVSAWAYDGESLRVTFGDLGLALVARGPSAFVTAGGGLTIPRAAEVRLSWYAFAPPVVDEHHCEVVYEPVGADAVRVTPNAFAAALYPPGVRPLPAREPLVRLE